MTAAPISPLPAVSLRALEPEDLDLFYDIENDPAVWDFTQAAQPYSRFAARQYIAQAPRDFFTSGEIRLVIVRKSDGAGVGFVDLVNYAPADGRAEVSIAIRRGLRHHGLAAAALRAVEELACRRYHLRLLYAEVSEHHNDVCNALFRAAGYRAVARLPRWHALGDGFEDILVYQKFLKKTGEAFGGLK